MRTSTLLPLSLAAFASVVSAQIAIINSCPFDVYIYQSTDGGCDYGSTGECFTDPWVFPASSTADLAWVETFDVGTSVKMATSTAFDQILQFEYTWDNGIYWDLSYLNGGVGLTVGTPFEGSTVGVGPVTASDESATCSYLSCGPDYEACADVYVTPDSDATNYCPETDDSFFIWLCL